jgi:ectoine hydroxylase-related dioxygenase (phytanoyl-CoA dioxygenase family)
VGEGTPIMRADPSAVTGPSSWFIERDCRLADLRAVLATRTDPARYPHADAVREDVLIYDSAALYPRSGAEEHRRDVQAEIATALLDGPGIVVLARAFPDTGVVERVTAAFHDMIAEQRAAGTAAGDHFATPGANDRVWNALEKLALRAPGAFADYYANDVLALVCSAWLGPGYQVTSQVNVVNPGGAAQQPHRDYHLGFQTNDAAERFPAHAHRLSPLLTLQGAVAHTDMPVESGPTMYLPHSHRYPPGYLAWRRPEFRAYFAEHHVQLPLAKGDAVFFNPALFHAAGHNGTTDVSRMANLLQVSSAFGRAMESVDRRRVALALFPALLARKSAGMTDRALRNVIAASAEGYPFPTNLDRDAPVDGLAPSSQADVVWRAVQEGWPAADLAAELDALATRRASG